MTILATDDFAGTGALSANWMATEFYSGSTEPTRVSGVLSMPAVTAGFKRYDGGITWPNNQYAKLTVGSKLSASDEGYGPAVRIGAEGTTNTSAYFLQSSSAEVKLYYKASGGGFTQLGSDASASTAGDVLELIANGTTITAKRNGTAICGTPVTDSNLTAGKAGFWLGLTLAETGDDFEGGDLSAGGSTDGPINSAPDGIPVAYYADPGWAAIYGTGQFGIPVGNRDSVVQSAGSISGAATAVGVGASSAAANFSETSTATVNGVGASLAASNFSETSTATVTGVGASLSASSGDFSSAGVATVTGVGASLASGNFASDGVSTETGVGASLASGNFSSAGVVTVTGVGATSGGTVAGDGAISGTLTMTGAGATIVAAAGSITCTSTVIGVPRQASQAARTRDGRRRQTDDDDLLYLAGMLVPLISRGGPLCQHR